MPTTRQTAEPAIITGTRPSLSAIFPLKGLEKSAVRAKREMISPLYSSPPRDVRYAGNSGMIMLKLAKKKNELAQISQNCREYTFRARPADAFILLHAAYACCFSWAPS